MPLDLGNVLRTIHKRFVTSDINENTFRTHVDSSVGINVVNIRLHLWIITTNSDIVERCIKFYYKNHFEPIRLNCALDEEKKNLKGGLT